MSQPLPSAEDILAAEDLAFEIVEVPEWNTVLRIQELSAEESLAFTDDMAKKTGDRDGMFLIIIHTARNPETLERVFTLEHLPRLRKKSMPVMNRLQRVALKVCKMGPDGQAALKKD